MKHPNPTNEEIISDMLAVYHDLGYLTHSAYRIYSIYPERIAERRFGTWLKALQVANIPQTRASKRLIPMTTTTCLSCDEWFDRPKDDPSCRRCPHCKRNQLAWGKEIQEGWEKVAG